MSVMEVDVGEGEGQRDGRRSFRHFLNCSISFSNSRSQEKCGLMLPCEFVVFVVVVVVCCWCLVVSYLGDFESKWERDARRVPSLCVPLSLPRI